MKTEFERRDSIYYLINLYVSFVKYRKITKSKTFCCFLCILFLYQRIFHYYNSFCLPMNLITFTPLSAPFSVKKKYGGQKFRATSSHKFIKLLVTKLIVRKIIQRTIHRLHAIRTKILGMSDVLRK